MASSQAPTSPPTISKRPADQRGRTEIAWLHSRHSFSFGEYHDPQRMSFGALRVLNDDVVEAGMGFGAHPHRDAEIFSYVIEGALEHRDSMGNGSVIRAGDLQYMSAGRGVTHSEFNPSRTERVHFLQVWLLPNVKGGEPRYAERSLGTAAQPNALTLLFSPEGRDGSIAMRQDAEVALGKLSAGQSLEAPLKGYANAYLHVIRGEIALAETGSGEGDGAAITDAKALDLRSSRDAEFLLFALH